MKDYSLSRAFRNDNLIAAENIQDPGRLRKVGCVSLGYSKGEMWWSYSTNSYAGAVDSTAVISSVSTDSWSSFLEGRQSSIYFHGYNFLWFDTGSISTRYGITGSDIIYVALRLEAQSEITVPAGATLTFRACVDSSPRALTQAVLNSGNYADSNKQAIFIYRRRPEDSTGLRTITYKPQSEFKDTFNWSGTTILALWLTLSDPNSVYVSGTFEEGSLDIYFKY